MTNLAAFSLAPIKQHLIASKTTFPFGLRLFRLRNLSSQNYATFAMICGVWLGNHVGQLSRNPNSTQQILTVFFGDRICGYLWWVLDHAILCQ